MTDALTRAARAICRERCAFYGDPPCHKMDEWAEGDDCGDDESGVNDVGCMALARAALAAAPDAKGGPR
jgi:hypothetical protein